MEISRRAFCTGLAATGIGWRQNAGDKVVRYLRYEHRGKIAYGALEGDSIREIRGDLFGGRAETGSKVKLADVKLLWPCEPTKLLAVGLNYKSHLGDRPAPEKPELFFKPLTSLQNPSGDIVIPPGAKTVSRSQILDDVPADRNDLPVDPGSVVREQVGDGPGDVPAG